MKMKFKKDIVDKLYQVIKEHSVVIFYVLANFINALLLRLFTTGTYMIRAFFIDLGFMIFSGCLSFLFTKKSRNVYFAVASFLLVICCILNSIYYNYYNSFASVSLLATSVFVGAVDDAIFDVVLKPTDLMYLWSLVGLYIVIKKQSNSFKPSKKKFIITFLLATIMFIIGSLLPPYNSFSRLIKLWNRSAVVNQSGIYVYQIDDIVQSLKPTFNNLFGRDKALQEVKEYYRQEKKAPVTNKYTKMFEGKNVIVIHAESLQTFTMGLSFNGKELTPNLNKIANSGIFFNNFYAQEGVGTSSDTEFTFATGLLPANVGTAFVNYFNNKYVTIQNTLHDKGYYVFAMHGNVGNFWNRDVMYKTIGYDRFYDKDNFIIDEEFGLGLSDKSFFHQAVAKIKEIDENIDKPFYGTLITLTNHIPWKDANKFNDYDISIPTLKDGVSQPNDYLSNLTIGRYLKSVHYMDEAIGNFFEDMDREGLLDDTIIVIYGDHDAKMGRKQFEYLYNYDLVNNRLYNKNEEGYHEFNDYDYILNKKVPFIIWSKDMKKGTIIDTPTGMIDTGAILGNMLGVYNKYSLGHDTLNISPDDGIVIFKDGSYITDKIYYSSKNNEAYAITNSIISAEDLKKDSDLADKMISISYNVITYDLIKDLE